MYKIRISAGISVAAWLNMTEAESLNSGTIDILDQILLPRGDAVLCIVGY